MKIVIPGGTGQVGTLLVRAFAGDGHEVVVLSRRKAADGLGRVAAWDGVSVGDWAGELEGADAVVNLAGQSVNCRYTRANRRRIMDSRLQSTRAVGEAIRRCRVAPRVWLQASTATIYAHTFDRPNDEATGRVGGGEPDAPGAWRFSIDVATAWEHAARESAPPATRQVLLRSAITLSPDPGGAFDLILRMVRLGLGGSAGDGAQYFSWIHEADFVRAVYRLIQDPSLAGPVNLAAPNPLTNEAFMRILREEWGIPFGLPAPAWLLEAGALLIRTESELLLKSRRVVPGLLRERGFAFAFPTWRLAARELCARWRLENGAALPRVQDVAG
jgi:uncharacterized protein (TIGR01777 family)